jgi:Domain of unknown function (DUF4249)
MKRFLLYFYLTVFGLYSCVTEIRDFEQIGNDSFLTIEAALSNQKGPYKVLISLSSPSISINTENKPITNARVFITDDKGKREDLTETFDGNYQTSTVFKGIVGYTYVLNIDLPNGKKYKSTPEKLIEAPLIDKVDAKFVVKTNYPTTDVRSVGYDVTLDFKDSPTPNQYYQWKWTHYEKTVYCASCFQGYDYDLGKCSTEPRFPFGQSKIELINFTCGEPCFDITSNSTYNVLSDNLLNGQQVSNYPIMRIPFNSPSLYYLKIEQRAISEKMYRYFRSIKEVTSGAGTLFDVPAETQFSPNIVSLDNPNEKILGAFEVFGLEQKIIYVDRNKGSEGYSPVRVEYPGRQLLAPPGSSGGGPRARCTEGKNRTKTEPEAFRE